MTTELTYLDNNATTEALPEVVEAASAAMREHFGNPSSSHCVGERARVLLEQSRDRVAALIGAEPEQLTFNSGSTEGANTVLTSVLALPVGQRRIVTSTIEHSATIRTCEWLEDQGVVVDWLTPTPDGLLDTEQLRGWLKTPASLVALHWVNNETGVVQPVEEFAEICQGRVTLYIDGAQAVGKLPTDLRHTGIDLLTFSGHKFHAPQGVGGLYARQARSFLPLVKGGGQEGGRRSGTENLPGIVGLGKAAEIRSSRLEAALLSMEGLRDHLEAAVQNAIPGVVVNGGGARRVCNTTNLRFEGVDGQALVARLDQAGVCCSQSSACTNQRPEPSHVLRAMGLSEEQAYSSVRFSFSELNDREDVEKALAALTSLCGQLRAFRAGVA